MGNFKVWLRQGERIYINGAVVRVDRKVSLEFMNDVTFLLEAHIMQPDATTTPLRQLYFMVQAMLMDPANTAAARELFARHHGDLMRTLTTAEIGNALLPMPRLIEQGRYFEALKVLRGLFPLEDSILSGQPVPTASPSPVVPRVSSAIDRETRQRAVGVN